MQDHLESLEQDCSSFLRTASQTLGRKSMSEKIRGDRGVMWSQWSFWPWYLILHFRELSSAFHSSTSQKRTFCIALRKHMAMTMIKHSMAASFTQHTSEFQAVACWRKLIIFNLPLQVKDIILSFFVWPDLCLKL